MKILSSFDSPVLSISPHKLEKGWIVKAFARAASLSSLGIHLLRGGREILSFATVPPEFARYGGLVPSQFFRNLSDGITLRRKIE